MDELTTLEGLDALIESTDATPAFIYKHSTTCGLSTRALQQVEAYRHNGGNSQPSITLVKVIESRPVSNAIAERFGVRHASPQLLLLDHGEVVWDASHHKITAENIAGAVAEWIGENGYV